MDLGGGFRIEECMEKALSYIWLTTRFSFQIALNIFACETKEEFHITSSVT